MKRNLLSLAALFMTMLFSVSAFAAVVDKTSLVGTSKEAWNAGGGPVNIDGISMPEKYETTTATLGDVMWQTVTGLENGTYTVELYANARFCPGRGFNSAATDGQMDCTFLFANDVELSIPVFHNPDLNNGQSYTLENVQVTDGTLRMGMTKKADGSNWHTIQIKALKFHVDPSVAYQAIIVTANEVKDQKMAADVKVALEEALATYGNVAEGDTETMDAALLVLTPAVDAAVASVKKYADYKVAIDGHYTVLNSTNVYTQEAYDTFKAAADAYLAKYDEGTLTENVVNPCAVQGWHSVNIYDDFLLSAWGTKDFDTNLYINTWSVEGEGDGSNFKVPFFEYWTGDGNSLEATTKTATVAGLEAGKKYVASAWVRVRMKNGAAAPTYGITLSVGVDGAPVDVAAGVNIPNSPFYIGEYKAVGVADAEGNLTINFNIAADNNISWLSFKNVKYAEFKEPANLDFSESTPVDNHITTYSKDMATNGTTYCNMLPVTGWNFGVANGDALAAGVFAYGGTPWIAGAGFLAPATNPEGVAEGNALGALACWGATVQYTQEVTLAPGNYVLTIPVYNSGAGVNVPSKSLIGFIAKDGTEYLAPAKAYTSNTWTSEVITFTLNEVTDGILTLGYTSPGGGGGANQHLFFDCVKIETASGAELAKLELAKAIAAAQATVDAKAGVGEGIFLIPTTALDTYAAAVAAANGVYENAEATAEELNAAIETLAAATEAYAAAKVLPAADKTYQIMHEAAGTFLALNGGVKVEAEASPLSFVAAGDGKYYIANA
ncbi:MAG: hypothetical protein II245_07830, partial [Bacteroidaceae bacterium]|nr:hypothetical protein [Bacteroidaceae bacterium]